MNENSLICKYIAQHPYTWLENLKEKHIRVKPDAEWKFAIFNYDPGADFSDPIVQEARGIILDTDSLEVACWPFRKFGNYGEPYVDEIDWNTALVQEKVDGSIIKLSYFNGAWNVSTNSVIDAHDAPIGDSGETFYDVFERACRSCTKNPLEHLDELDKDNTYIFELVSPETRVVVDYNTTELYHTGTRNKVTGQELRTDIGVRHPKEYPLRTLDECTEAARALNAPDGPVTDEGFVVVDANWNRVKIKSPEYVKLHHAIAGGAITDKQLLNYIISGEIDEVLTYVPSLRERADDMRAKIDRLEEKLTNYCAYWKGETYAAFLEKKAELTKRYIADGIPDSDAAARAAKEAERAVRKDFAAREGRSFMFALGVRGVFGDEKPSALEQYKVGKIKTEKYIDALNSTTTLHVMVGVPGSGKSRYAETHADKGDVVVSTDAIRAEVFGDINDQKHNAEVFEIFYDRIKEALLSGAPNVYADATNVNPRNRMMYSAVLRPFCDKMVAEVMDTPYEECVRRDAERERTVGESVIKRFCNNQKSFADWEKFTEIRHIEMDYSPIEREQEPGVEAPPDGGTAR